jgi:hypothetical protein
MQRTDEVASSQESLFQSFSPALESLEWQATQELVCYFLSIKSSTLKGDSVIGTFPTHLWAKLGSPIQVGLFFP